MTGPLRPVTLPLSATDREVIRDALLRIPRQCRYDRRDREARHWFLRRMLAYHRGWTIFGPP
jgi:hypothetical protein